MTVDFLKERTRKYGRNVTIAAGVILVLAWVPGIKINKFKPLGFDICDSPGGELSLWCLLAGILGYYFVRFWINLRIDYFVGGHKIWKAFEDRQAYKNERQYAIKRKDPGVAARAEKMFSAARPGLNEVWQFYILDAGLPVVLFTAAAIAAGIQISALWPSGAPPTP